MLMVGAAFAPGTCQTSSRKSPLRSALFRGTGFPGYFMLLALVDEAERDKLLPVALLLKELLPIPLLLKVEEPLNGKMELNGLLLKNELLLKGLLLKELPPKKNPLDELGRCPYST